MKVNILSINLIAMYKKLHNQILSLQNDEKRINEQMEQLSNSIDSKCQDERKKKQEQIDIIDKEIEQIDVYEYGAKCYGAILSTYNPVAENIHPVEFQQLYTMLSGNPHGRATANELLKKCANQKKYYYNEKEKIERLYTTKIEEIKNSSRSELERLRVESNRISSRYDELAEGTNAIAISKEINERAFRFFIKKGIIYETKPCNKTHDIFCLGFIVAPYPLDKAYSDKLKKTFGHFYDITNQSLLLPLCIVSEAIKKDGYYPAINISIKYDQSTRERENEITQGVLFNILRNYTPLTHRVTYIDFDTFNSEYLGYMKKYVGDEGMINFPTNLKQAKSALQKIELNAESEHEKQRQRRFLFVKGIESNQNNELFSHIKKICKNFQKNNITTVFVDFMHNQNYSSTWEGLKFGLSISSINGQFITNKLGENMRFCFFAPPSGLSQNSESLFHAAFIPPKIDNKYESFFDLSEPIPYLSNARKRERLIVNYGLDVKKNSLSRIAFEKMDFATFLMGGSGSGKTTLIHTIITDIIKNYHPDEVELWLADFKYSGFSPYVVKNIPPHIKYILMDKSDEMIFDFIDIMHAELERRERLTGIINTEDRLDVSVKVYLPTILVIIDEFSAVSQAFEHDYSYKDKLDDLLSKGRSKGFRFIFASQDYKSSANALSAFAKKQISSRIAMKNSDIDEIKDTLNIPSSQKNADISLMIDTLTDHYTLYKKQKDDGTIEIIKSLVLYFDKNDWTSRYNLYEEIRNSLSPIDEKTYSGLTNQYVDKHPVIVSSETFIAFNTQKFISAVHACRSDDELALSEDDVIVSFGVPRNLSMNSYAFISKSARENIFLLSKKEEVICSMSVVLSTIRSFLNQNGTAQIWGHSKNQIYRKYKDSHFSKLSIFEGKQNVAKAIEKIYEDIKKRKKSNQLIVLLGMELLYKELNDDLDEFNSSSSSFDIKPLLAKTSEEIDDAVRCNNDEKELAEMMDDFYEKGEAEGRSEEELDAEFELVMQKYYDKKQGKNTSTVKFTTNENNITSEYKEAIDYTDRFKFLLETGSRFGYHFMLVIDDFNNLRDMNLGKGLFNHRIAFKTKSSDISQTIFDSNRATKISRHMCFYSSSGSSSQSFLFSPFLHKGVTWDNWTIDEKGNAVNPSAKYKE